jgi:hypothetical protein
MLALAIEPLAIDPAATQSPAAAFEALAAVAQSYLGQMSASVNAAVLPRRAALLTRVRGTGPGVSFGRVVDALKSAPLDWKCPFEGSLNVSGAVLTAVDLLGGRRDDGFLFLRFKPQTQDLPLHVHDDSDRFIFANGGRGFFHVSPDELEAGRARRLRHTPVRNRDALMFRRGTVHTFSTADEPLTLLSYHHPYLPLEDERQYRVSSPPETPAEFLRDQRAVVSFDAGWNVLAEGGE